MASNLEQKIGELTGTLNGLTQAFERTEKRVNDSQLDIRTLQGEVKQLKFQDKTITSDSKDSKKFWLDVLKMFIAVAIGALIERLTKL